MLSECSAPKCAEGVMAKGLCRSHYDRWRNSGGMTTASGVPPIESACVHCGAVIDRASHHKLARYCSNSCQNAATYRRRKAAGTVRAKPRKPSQTMTCAVCSGSFEATRSDARYCSPRCRNAGSRDSSSSACSQADCGRSVRARGLCSKHWRRWARAEGIEKPSEWTPERRARWKAREVAKRAPGASTEPIDPTEVFNRDGWLCGICGDPVDAGLSYPDPGSKSLDHIVPLSRGGGHTLDNVQLAHLFCNLSKGAAVPA